VLIVGGFVAAERFDPTRGESTDAGQMAMARSNHSATPLPDGQVLIAGGLDNDNRALVSCELYDPETNTWTLAPGMTTARSRHTAVLLPDGRVLVAGGQGGPNDRPVPLASAEIFDLRRGEWSPVASMAAARVWHVAALLDGGGILVAGGAGDESEHL